MDAPSPIYIDAENENKYLDPSASGRSHLQAAKDLLEQNGSLSEVASLLEAAIQKGELGEGGYETWIMLGEVKSMDEHEDAAMRALAEGVKRAEAAGATGQGMLVCLRSYLPQADIEAGLVTGYLVYKRVVRACITYGAFALAACSLPGLPHPRGCVEVADRGGLALSRACH